MITSLHLENWRSHHSTSLVFRRGTNLLIGIMGSGKSSVLDGMCFALFGRFPALEHRTLSTEDVIRHGSERALVRLSLEWQGASYEIVREIRRDRKGRASSEAEVRGGGRLIEKGQSAVTKYIEHLLHVDYDLFTRAIYSEQNGIDRFLSLEAGRRKQEMDLLLGLDKFEDARANAVRIINAKKALCKKLEERFDQKKLDGAREREKDARAKLAESGLGLEKLADVLKSANSEYERQNLLFSDLRAKKDKADALSSQISSAKGSIAQLREELEGKACPEQDLDRARTELAETEKLLAERKKELLQMQSKQNALYREAGALESKLNSAKSAASELEKSRKESELLLSGRSGEQLEKERADNDRALLEDEARLQARSSEIRKLEEGMKRIEPGMSRCPVCRCKLTPEGVAHVLEEYGAEISSKKAESAKLAAQKDHHEKSREALESRIARLRTITERISLLSKSAAELDSVSAKLALAQKEAESVSVEVKSRRQAIEDLTLVFQNKAEHCKLLEDLTHKKKKLAKLEEGLKAAESESAALGFNGQIFEDARKGLEEARASMEKRSSELGALKAQKQLYSDMLLMLSSELAELESLALQISEFRKLDEELLIYKNALVETQSELRKEVVDAINSAMNEIWGIIYPYGDYRALRMSADESGYSFQVFDGEWRAAEMVSGGERASIALALRIALATVLTPNMSMLILDEPTHNLDKEAVGVLAHALQYNLPELVEQSFVITHDEGLMGSEFAVTYRMKRDKKENSPTVCEEM